MANPQNIIGAFSDEVQEIGKQVVSEVAKIPKDITGKALESMGVGGSKKKQGNTPQSAAPQQPTTEQEAFANAKSDEEKRVIARKALEEILGGNRPKQKEMTVWEKIQKEEADKKETQKQQKAQAAKMALPQSKGKRPRGDLYGMKAKKASAEMSRNVRQD